MKVVITDYQYDDIRVEKELIIGAGHSLADYQYCRPEQLIPVLKDADAVIVQYADIDRSVIEAMDHCRMIIKYGIGVDNIDTVAAAERGIYVCNVPDYGVEEVSDHAVTMILALAKKLPVMSNAMKNGHWGYHDIIPLQRFCESTVGLVGFGRIPRMVAKKLSGFGVRILAFDPYLPAELFTEAGVERVDLDTLCRKSDFVSIHCPQTPETTGLFGRPLFQKMKCTAFLINTARGGIVNQRELLEALQAGEIAGAGLDVYETEPPDLSSALFSLENVIATPHCAWYSERSISVLQRKTAEEVVHVLAGNKPFHCVNLRAIQNHA